jgi:hypothetical protein
MAAAEQREDGSRQIDGQGFDEDEAMPVLNVQWDPDDTLMLWIETVDGEASISLTAVGVEALKRAIAEKKP